MRKSIAVFILFTLLATAAFAEVEVGAEIKGSWYVLEGEKDSGPLGNDLKPKPWIGSYWAEDGHNILGSATVTATNKEETLGGFIQLQGLPSFYAWGNVWWQPISQLKATLGYIEGDANMAGDIVTVDDELLPVQYLGGYDPDRYNDTTYRVIHNWGWESEDAAATIELFPVENLYLIATVPLVQQDKFVLGNSTPAGDIFAQTAVRLAYTIGDIGQVAVTWDGGTMTALDDGWYDPAFIGAHFSLLAIENLEASIGFEYPLPIKKYHRDYSGTPTKPDELKGEFGKFTRQLPVGLDLRANFTASDFNLGFGFAAYFAGYEQIYHTKDKTKDPFEFGITLNPSYAFSALTVGLVGEVGFTAKDKNDKTSENVVKYNMIPYVQKDLGPGSIYAGVQVDGSSGGDIHWAIPIGFVVSF